jgi:CheY-like chemotaxis protein
VRNLVELHGGSVRASSPGEGQGSTFVVTLPVRKAKETREPEDLEDMPMYAASMQIDLSGVKVLTVDDEADARQLVKRVLTARGATAFCAANASDALELLRRELPDVVLCDIGMPDEDGFALLAKLRALDSASGGQVPVVALTAFARPEDRRRMLLAGFQMHVAKPVEPAELIAVVANIAKITRNTTEPAN